jgi:NhaP-type Na+/H+ or K+/H+ antiporter
MIDPSIPIKTRNKDIGMMFLQLICGVIIGLLLGLVGLLFNKYNHMKHTMFFKAFYAMTIIASLPMVANKVAFPNIKFIGALTFGYVLNRVWGKHKPAVELTHMWTLCAYFFFGTVGAQLNFRIITGSIIGKSFIISIVSLLARLIGVFLCAIHPRYTMKERLFMAFNWIPKAAVQATLSGAFALTVVKLKGS